MLRNLLLVTIFIVSSVNPVFSQANQCSDVLNFPKLSQINKRIADPSYKVIIMGRHGKASQINKFTAAERSVDPLKVKLDKERPLAKKGKRGAKQLAELMSNIQFSENVGMWGSPARRVVKTAEPTIDMLGGKVKVNNFKKKFYYANVPKEMREELTSPKGERVSEAFFWGHGKTTLELFKDLTGAKVAFLPTAGIMIVAIKADSWQQVFRGEGKNIEGFMWSPNQSHKVEGQEVPLSNLEAKMVEEGVGGLEANITPENIGGLEVKVEPESFIGLEANIEGAQGVNEALKVLNFKLKGNEGLADFIELDL